MGVNFESSWELSSPNKAHYRQLSGGSTYKFERTVNGHSYLPEMPIPDYGFLKMYAQYRTEKTQSNVFGNIGQVIHLTPRSYRRGEGGAETDIGASARASVPIEKNEQNLSLRNAVDPNCGSISYSLPRT